MQIHVDRAAFVEAATKAASFADDPMPIVRIDAGERVTFSATNNERFCRLVIDGNVGKRGAIVVDAHRIAAVAKGLTGSVVEITSTDSRMTIKGGATYTVPIVDPIDIMAPEFPEEHADVNGAALARAMTATSYAIGGGLTKSGVPGVWMEQRPDEVLVTSTDGHRLATPRSPPRAGSRSPRAPSSPPKRARASRALAASCRSRSRSAGSTPGSAPTCTRGGASTPTPPSGAWSCPPKTTRSRLRRSRCPTSSARWAARTTSSARRRGPTKFSIAPGDCNIHTPGETEHSEPIPCETEATFMEGVRPAYIIDAIRGFGNVDRVRVEARSKALHPMIIRPDGESESMAIVMPMRID